MSNRKGWWYSATTEQRLAQVVGGIECGMTARQIAMVSGLDMGRHPEKVVANFAAYYGKPFIHSRSRAGSVASVGTLRAASIKRDRAAYFRGDHIDPWGVDEDPSLSRESV